MVGRVFFDGLNLSLPQGTGVATYTRILAQVVRDLGGEVGVVYASAQKPPKDPMLREVAFFDEKRERQDTAGRGKSSTVPPTSCGISPQSSRFR